MELKNHKVEVTNIFLAKHYEIVNSGKVQIIKKLAR